MLCVKLSMARLRCALVFTFFLCSINATALAVAQDFQAGAAKRVITPDPLLPISGGLGPGAPSKSKQGELTVRALVISQANTQVALVSIDALGFPSVLGKRISDHVSEIPAENILIGATHTHSAPDCYAFPDGRGGHTGDLKYIDRVCQCAVEAIQEARSRLQPATLKAATGEAAARIAYNYYAPDLYDRRVSVLQVLDKESRAIGTLVNYAVHPEVLGSNGGITSPDLIGPLCDRIESEAGGLGLFFNGAQGGMVTADNRDLDKPKDAVRGYWEDKRSWDECVRIGHALADDALKFIQLSEVQTQPTLTCLHSQVDFPVESDLLWQVIQGSPLKYPSKPNRTITSRINLIQIGNAQVLTIPGEALPNIGFYLKRKMRGEHNLLFGLTNDAFGYILTRVDFDSFKRYEYVSRTSLGEQTGEILIDQSLKLIDRLR